MVYTGSGGNTLKYVIAGNIHEYEAYLSSVGLSPKEAKYVHSPDQLRGRRNLDVVVFGSYWLNPAYEMALGRELLHGER